LEAFISQIVIFEELANIYLKMVSKITNYNQSEVKLERFFIVKSYAKIIAEIYILSSFINCFYAKTFSQRNAITIWKYTKESFKLVFCLKQLLLKCW